MIFQGLRFDCFRVIQPTRHGLAAVFVAEGAIKASLNPGGFRLAAFTFLAFPGCGILCACLV
jgi:hypothetical protein